MLRRVLERSGLPEPWARIIDRALVGALVIEYLFISYLWWDLFKLFDFVFYGDSGARFGVLLGFMVAFYVVGATLFFIEDRINDEEGRLK
ncbi:MAG: hypothetical protein MJH10_09215 [Epibacterium sp.]|nr:hypothetical protein [Epibacterium sp.]NQX73714.1 hypothetical protein [Epibacterium sp.]